MKMSIRAVGFMLVLVLALATACSNRGAVSTPTATPQPATPTPEPASTPVVQSSVSTVRVAYLNLMNPKDVTADEEGTLATYQDRLDIAIDDLRTFGPDIVGVSEATWIKDRGPSSWERLVSGLQMEGSQLARANPWPFNLDKKGSDQLVDALGYEEGEYLLSRFPILSQERTALTPAVTTLESRAVLHAVVKIPEPVGETDVYVTRFGGQDWQLQAQAESLHEFILRTHDPEREIIVMGDFGVSPDSEVLAKMAGWGLQDVAAAAEPAILTCCRQAVVLGAGQPTPGPSETADGDSTPAPDPGAVTVRTDYVLVSQWQPDEMRSIGNDPVEQPDGSYLYASDHNGLAIVFDVKPQAPEGAP